MRKDLKLLAELRNSLSQQILFKKQWEAGAVNYKICRFHVVTKLNDRFDSPFTN